ncbi:DUF3054 domain-containing protein [Halostagnicola bangensis]
MSTRTRFGDVAGGFTREGVGLGVVDIALLSGLVTYGHLHHGGNPLANPLGAVEAIVPFLIGWVLVSMLAGLYTRGVYADPARVARYATLCWIAAANLGLIIRSSPLFDGGAAYPFNLVITGTGLVVFVLWRTAFAVSR